VCVEPPHKVKKAFYDKGKTDPVDSRQIAEYGYRFRDKLHSWQPREELLESLRVLLTLREQFKKAQTASRNAKRALTRKHHAYQTAVTMYTELVRYLSACVRDVERDMQGLLSQNPTLSRQTMNLTTLPGVGFLLAVSLAVVTNGFTEHVSHKELAAYLGICPYPHESGTTVYRPPSSDGAGPSRLRKLLFLAALSARQHHPEMEAYFVRKVAEGKPRMVVVNNIANKLLKVVCAMLRSGKPYLAHYRSVNPREDF
jgi:transposase